MNKYIVFFIFLSFQLHAQQEGLFTQYMFNPAIFNPAYVVTKDTPSFYLQHRKQWGNFEGSPKTAFMSYQHPSLFQNLGFGLNVVSDNLGPVSNFNVSTDFATLVRVSDKWNTSLGIKLAYNSLNVNFDLLNIYNPSDPFFTSNIENLSFFNVGFGVFVFSEKTYFGFSSPSILKQNHFNDESLVRKASSEQHYYFTAGHVISVSEDLKIKPSVIVRSVKNLPMQMDVSANGFFFNKFILGASYRLKSSISATAGFYVSNSLLIGYSHDSETNRLRSFAGNSSEFFLRWEIQPKEIVNPRFF